jgi:outer membrane protein OmpA-like peptidoglycan-associated protein
MNARVQVEMKQAVERLPAPTPASFGTLQRKCACGGSGASSGSSGECPNCKRKKALQRRAAGSAQPDAAPPIVHDVLRSPGQPLDTATRAYFEPRFGHDFSKVRIHADARASESARAVSAVAYTVGHDVVFGAGRHEPGTQAGRELLAHELTHVVQQSGAPLASTLRIGSVADPSEKEAEAVAAGATKIPAAAAPVSRLVQRQAIGTDSDSNDQTGTDLAAQNQQASSTDSASQSAASGAASDEKPEVCPPPTDMACPAGTDPTTGVSKTIVFPVDSSTLSTAQKADLDAAAATWNSGGASGMVRVDGYASAEYECEYNWRLSCRRAQAAAAELENPSDGSKGVPADPYRRQNRSQSRSRRPRAKTNAGPISQPR